MNDGTQVVPDLRDLGPDPFLQRLDALRRLYREMGLALSVETAALQEKRKASKLRDELSYEEWEHGIYDELEHDLEECESLRADFVAVFLAEAVRRLLTDVRSELERNRTGSKQRAGQKKRNARKKRSDWLQHFGDFFVNFGIQLNQGPGWVDIQNVVSARDKVIHNSRFEYERSPVDAKTFPVVLNQLQDFCSWLRAEVRKKEQS